MRGLRTLHRLAVLLTLAAFGLSATMGTIISPAQAHEHPPATSHHADGVATGACSHDEDAGSARHDGKAGHSCDFTCSHHWAALSAGLLSFMPRTPAMPILTALPLPERSSFFLPLRPPAV